MKKLILSLLSITISLVFVYGAAAIEFSADVINKANGQMAPTSKMYMKNKKMRMDNKSGETYTIVRQDLDVSWVVMPKQKTYMEMKSHKPEQIPQEKMKGEISRKLIGSETVDGHPTKKYEVTYTEGKQVLKSYQWIATDLNFPIKMMAADERWSMEYKNIKIGPQPDSLFEIPKGYQKMAMPHMPMSGRGVAPGKMPKGFPVPESNQAP
jgi:hypothetical protein